MPRFVKTMFLALPILLSGCGFLGIGTKPQPSLVSHTSGAPYRDLADKSVAVIVYAPQSTLNTYTGAREEIPNFVVTEMRSHMPTTHILEVQDMLAWQNGKLNWANLSPREIGRHFNVDRVITIELLDYSTRRPMVVSNLQGRLRAQCRIYDTAANSPGPDDAGRMAPVWTGLVDAAWPSGKPLDPTQTNEAAVRLRTLETFANLLVQFFYESREPDASIRG